MEMSIKGKIQMCVEFIVQSRREWREDGQLGEEYSRSTTGHKWDAACRRQAN